MSVDSKADSPQFLNSTNTAQVIAEPVRLSQCFTYSLPVTVTYFLFYPAQILLAGMYAKYFGLSLTTIAAVVFAARLFDAVTDPLIGYWSDRSRARTGTRKPWVIIGGLGLVISSYFLYVPPDNVSVAYFTGWYFAFYLAITIAEVPHMAWGGELASSSHEKTQIYSVRVACQFFGTLLFTVAPLLPFFVSKGFTPETLKWSVLASAVVILPMLVLVTLTPNGRASTKPKKESPRLLLNTIIHNKPLLILLAGFFLISFGYGFYFGLSFIFADVYLGLGDQLPLVFAFSTFAGLAGAGLVYKLARYIEKVKIYALAVILTSLALTSLALLRPGTGSLVFFTGLTCVIYLGNAIIQATVLSQLSDIADYGSWKFGVDRAATYFSAYLFLQKVIIGIGGALGLALVGWYGFDASAINQTDESIFGLRLTIAYLPAFLVFASLIVIVRIPINARRHSIIQRRISSRIQRSTQRQAIESPQSLPAVAVQI